jgi:hypothetical protein
MKVASSLFFASLALAAPQGQIERRQVAQELSKGEKTWSRLITKLTILGSDCKDVTFIFVRGTTEPANLVGQRFRREMIPPLTGITLKGMIIGGKLVPELRKVFPSLAVEGVTYGAGIAGNLLPGGGDPAGITEATKDYTLASKLRCLSALWGLTDLQVQSAPSLS